MIGKVSNVTLAILAVCFCFVVGAISLLQWGGKDIQPVVAFATGVLASVIPQIMTMNKVNSIDLKVNGNMTRLIDGISAAAQNGNQVAIGVANDPTSLVPPVVLSAHDTQSTGQSAPPPGS